MKKILTIALTILMSFGLTACGETKKTAQGIQQQEKDGDSKEKPGLGEENQKDGNSQEGADKPTGDDKTSSGTSSGATKPSPDKPTSSGTTGNNTSGGAGNPSQGSNPGNNQPGGNAKPTEPVKPLEPVNPTEPVKPPEPVKPTEPVNPGNGSNGQPSESGKLKSLDSIMSDILAGVNLKILAMNTAVTADKFSWYFGIDPVPGAEGLASEAMISSVAHSVALLRVPDGANAAKIAASIEQNANPRKWICVGAEKTIVKQKGNLIVLIMSSKDVAEGVAANFDAQF